MATLTNTKIKDTYVGLLKTTDNQAIDASGVTLVEDGAGNASALSVGRSGNGVSVSGNLAVDTDTLYVDATSDFVGIGTSTQTVNGESLRIAGDVFVNSAGTASVPTIALADSNSGLFAPSAGQLAITTQGNERLRIDGSGNVGIGTSPTSPLHVNSGTLNTVARFESTDQNATIKIIDSFARTDLFHNVGQFEIVIDPDDIGSASKLIVDIDSSEVMRIESSGYLRLASAGIQFNGDTSDDNSLDDYEEGTFTPTYTTDDGDFDTIDYGTQTGRYTKIGRVVYIDIFLRAGNITYSGSVTSASKLRIAGLPYTSIGGFSTAGGSISFINNWGNINNPNAILIQSGQTEVALHLLSQTASRYALAVSDLDTGTANSRNDIRMSFFYFV